MHHLKSEQAGRRVFSRVRLFVFEVLASLGNCTSSRETSHTQHAVHPQPQTTAGNKVVTTAPCHPRLLSNTEQTCFHSRPDQQWIAFDCVRLPLKFTEPRLSSSQVGGGSVSDFFYVILSKQNLFRHKTKTAPFLPPSRSEGSRRWCTSASSATTSTAT